MSTRGVYGFRCYGIDKLSYNHSGSYPEHLGKKMVEFIKLHSTREMEEFYDSINLVEELSIPPERCCAFYHIPKGRGTWYDILRNFQGDLEAMFNFWESEDGLPVHMTEANGFIKDSLFCEYGYIINLDDETLEFWVGFQESPTKDNRYGETANESGYYPCKMVKATPLEDIRTYNFRKNSSLKTFFPEEEK